MTTVLLDPISSTSTRLDEPIGNDIEIEDFKLELANSSGVEKVMARDVVLDAVLERTMEGASHITVSLHDPLGKILNSGAFSKPVDVYVDGMWWRMVAVNKNDSELELVFEDRDVTYVRKHKEVVKGNRKDMTRAEFCVRLLKKVKAAEYDVTTKFIDPFSAEPGITIVCPELHKTQPKKNGKKEKKEVRDRKREAGLYNTGQLYVWYSTGDSNIPRDSGVANNPLARAWPFSVKKANNAQLDIGEQILDECARQKVPRKLMIAALATAMEESGLTNPTQAESDRDSEGPFQQRASQGWKGLRDVPRATAEFLKFAKQYHAQYPNDSIGELACRVQMNNQIIDWVVDKINSASAFCGPWVDAYGGAPLSKIAYRRRYMFSTASGGKKEDWWTAIGRILSEVGWVRFMSNGVCYIIAEEDLLNSKVRMKLSEATPGINRINFNYDVGQAIATATVTCRATRWVAPPGSVVVLSGCGPANGRWLVSNISRSLYSRDCTITLKKPEPKLSEPQADLMLRESIDEWITRNHRGSRGEPVGDYPRDSIFGNNGTADANIPRGRVGKVIYGPGSIATGYPHPQDMAIFCRLIAGMTSETIIINSATRFDADSNHDVNGRGAADIDVGGDARSSEDALRKGTNIAIAALRVCGLSYREAKQFVAAGRTDFYNNLTWRGHSVEIGWLTLVGGNHYNHVHVGFDS